MGEIDILVAERPNRESPFGTPQLVPGVNSTSIEANPWLTSDELVILFNSNRAGSSDIYYAVRSSKDQPFTNPTIVQGINTSHRESEASLSADGCEIFFASDRPGGMGGYDLYRAPILVH